ncbi:MAG: hypothetical protein R3E48_11465 [Burkholderiaceae bacterium]
MAVIIPGDWRASEVLGGNARVIETLALFARGLPASLTVFHGVHWTRVERGLASIGEIDFVVLAPSGHLLLIEQKTGFLEESPDGLLMRHAGRKKLVRVEVDRTVDALRRRLGPALQGAAVPEIGYLLHCPDYHVREPGSAGMDPARIVDASAPDTLCQRVITALGADAGSNGPADDPLIANRLHRFFANELELVPDASAMVGRAEAIVTRLSGGLATWARRLDADPFRLRVLGTAGSGKTQLALALLRTPHATDARRATSASTGRWPITSHGSRRRVRACRPITNGASSDCGPPAPRSISEAPARLPTWSRGRRRSRRPNRIGWTCSSSTKARISSPAGAKTCSTRSVGRVLAGASSGSRIRCRTFMTASRSSPMAGSR